MRKRTDEEKAEWSVTKDGLSWLDEKGNPLQVDQATGRLLKGAVLKMNGAREWQGPGILPPTPAAFYLMAAAVERVRGKRHVSREEARRIGDEALEAALKVARLGQLELPVG